MEEISAWLPSALLTVITALLIYRFRVLRQERKAFQATREADRRAAWDQNAREHAELRSAIEAQGRELRETLARYGATLSKRKHPPGDQVEVPVKGSDALAKQADALIKQANILARQADALAEQAESLAKQADTLRNQGDSLPTSGKRFPTSEKTSLS